jgi:hypothetical protein
MLALHSIQGLHARCAAHDQYHDARPPTGRDANVGFRYSLPELGNLVFSDRCAAGAIRGYRMISWLIALIAPVTGAVTILDDMDRKHLPTFRRQGLSAPPQCLGPFGIT